MSNKGLMDVIEDMLEEGVNDHINKITMDNIKDGKSFSPAAPSADPQGVLGTTTGAALDGGGDKDVGDMNKGKIASGASADTQGVEGKHNGAALDAGGDADVGNEKTGDHYKKGHPSDASGTVEADKGPHDQANDPGLKEEDETIDEEEVVAETDEVEAEASVEEETEASVEEETDEVEEAAPVSLAGPNGKKIKATKDPKTGSYKVDEDAMEELTTEEREEFLAMEFWSEEAEEVEEKLHGDQHKLDHNDNNKIDASDMKQVRKKGATAHLNNEETEEVEEANYNSKNWRPDNSVKQDKSAENTVKKAEGDNRQKAKDSWKNFNMSAKKEEVEVEDEAIQETEGETLKKVSGEANAAQRPAQEKGKNEPETKQDPWKGHAPHDQASDPMETPTKANPKGAVSEESEEAAIDEDFKARAEVIFEAAVGEKVNVIREEMEAMFDKEIEEHKAALDKAASDFLEEAVAEWMEENALEIKYSLRTEIAENFISGLKSLFEESYIEIPEEDYSAVDELTESVEEQKEQIDALTEELVKARAFILESKRKEIVSELCEDLTQTQAVRLEKLTKGLEAADIEEFRTKVAQLKEGYFDPSNETPFLELSEEVYTGTEEMIQETDGTISAYANFLSKTVMK